MGLFSRLFGKRDHSASILQAGVALADEVERVYRNQLESLPPTGTGLLKARLLSSSFAAAVYIVGDCAKNQEDMFSFINACSGIAMRPFNQPGANLRLSRQDAASFAGAFMTKALKLIQSELSDGPSTLDRKTEPFQKLINMYHHCLAESVGEQRYKAQMKQKLETFAESIIWTHFRFLGDMLNQVK
jgi:hypothetical protein